MEHACIIRFIEKSNSLATIIAVEGGNVKHCDLMFITITKSHLAAVSATFKTKLVRGPLPESGRKRAGEKAIAPRPVERVG